MLLGQLLVHLALPDDVVPLRREPADLGGHICRHLRHTDDQLCRESLGDRASNVQPRFALARRHDPRVILKGLANLGREPPQRSCHRIRHGLGEAQGIANFLLDTRVPKEVCLDTTAGVQICEGGCNLAHPYPHSHDLPQLRRGSPSLIADDLELCHGDGELTLTVLSRQLLRELQEHLTRPIDIGLAVGRK